MMYLTRSRSGRLFGSALAISLLVGACRGGAPAGQQGPQAIPVQLQELESGTIIETSEFVGALEAQEKVELRPVIAGRVVDVFVSEGQRVEAGTPIVQLRAERDRAEVGGAIADVEASRAALNTAVAQLRAAEADRVRAAADVELQETEYERTQVLVAEGAQSQQQLDRAANSRSTAIATLRAVEEDIRAAQAAVNEAQANLARSQADQAAVAQDLSDKRVVAPIAGIVGNVAAKVGDYVDTNNVLTSIVQNSSMELNVSVPIEQATRLRVGLPVELLDANNQARIRGRVSFVSPEVNTTQQSVLAKVTFTNDGTLRDGQFVRTRIVWDSSPGILVPTEAVTRIAGQTFVFVAETGEAAAEGPPQQIARQRLVTLGDIQGNTYQVISGLEAGEQVVVAGVLNLQDGVPIMVDQAVSEQ